jgi:hypothetical protein
MDGMQDYVLCLGAFAHSSKPGRHTYNHHGVILHSAANHPPAAYLTSQVSTTS